MIEFINVYKKYKSSDKFILNDITLTLPTTGIIILKGENGVGKTTFLNLIAGLTKPTSGIIKINNYMLNTLSCRETEKYRLNNISYLSVEYNLLEELNVKDNIDLIKGSDSGKEKALNYLKIKDKENNIVETLSGGEKKRVQIIREMSKKSKIYLCDEVTTGLDNENAKSVYKILEKLSQQALVIISTHENNIENFLKPNEILFFQNGTISQKIKKGSNYEIYIKNDNKYEISKDVKQQIIQNQINSKNGKKFLLSFILFFLIFICFLLGYLSNLDFGKIEVQALKDNNSNTIHITNSDDEFVKIISKITTLDNILDIKEIYEYQLNGNRVRLNLNYLAQDNIYYNNYWFINYFEEADIFEQYSLLLGNTPQKENEVMIYQHLADNILKHGSIVETPQRIVKSFQDYEDIIGETFYIETIPIKVVGIIKQNIDNYEILKRKPLKFQEEFKGQFYTSLFVNEIVSHSSNLVVAKDFQNYFNSFEQKTKRELREIVIEVKNNSKIDETMQDISKLGLNARSIYRDNLNIINKKYIKFQNLFFYGFILSIILLITLLIYFIDSIIKKQKNIEEVFLFLGFPHVTNYQMEWIACMRFLIPTYVISLLCYIININIANGILFNIFFFKIKMIQISIFILFLITIIVFIVTSFIIYILGKLYRRIYYAKY